MQRNIAPQEIHQALDALWVKLRDIERIKDGNWRVPHDYMERYLLVIVFRGHAQVNADGFHHSLAAGSAVVCLPGQLVKATADAQEGAELYVIRFDALADAAKPCTPERPVTVFPFSGEVVLSDSSWLVLTCEAAASLWQSGDSLHKFQAQSLFQSMLHRLVQDALLADAEPGVDRAISKTRQYMEQFFERNITIDSLAEMAGVSRYYYMRSFKLAYGMSAMDYLTGLRIEHAKRLMEKTDIRLRDIACQVGYGDEYYFNRKFKQKVGMPPVAYKKSRKRRVVAYSFLNTGQLLALRIVPYAAPMDHTWTDLYRKKYDSDVVVKLSHDYPFNLEAIRQAQPDYIIGVDRFVPQQEQEKLRQIAPSLFVPWLTHDWRGHLQLVANFLGNEAQAKLWQDEYERKAATVKETVRRKIGTDTVLVVQVHRDKCFVYGKHSSADVLYEDLQLSSPAGVERIFSYAEVTMDELAAFDADWLFVMFSDGSDGQARLAQLGKTAEWARLKAMAKGTIMPVSPSLWFDYSAYTQDKFLHDVHTLFKA